MVYVTERFTSFQGTGHLAGVRQHFVRFAGCGVACPIKSVCDEPAALVRRSSSVLTPEDIVGAALAEVGSRGWLHITGGEPTDQPDELQRVVMLARRSGLYVHLQTSGVRRVPIQWDWLTVSPKVAEPVQTFGQEMVVVDDGSVTVERLNALRLGSSFWSYYVCPLWGRPAEPSARLAAAAGWDLTTQMHKHLGLR